MKKSTREVIFFILVFLLFFITMSIYNCLIGKISINKDVFGLLLGLIYTLIIIGIFYLGKIHHANEKFWDVSPFAKCKGGPYFWQGDSETSKMCRKLAESPQGRIGLSSYNCPVGYVGQPGLPFVYSPDSNDNWQNERCKQLPSCKGQDLGLCSLEKQVS